MARFHILLVSGCILLLLSPSCAFPPPRQATVSALMENPAAYRYERIEVSGAVQWAGKGDLDFPYWHFHLQGQNADLVCYSEAYKHQVWSTIDLLIRRAAREGKEVIVTGYLTSWGAGRVVLRVKEITYEGHTYNAELIPPTVSVGF